MLHSLSKLGIFADDHAEAAWVLGGRAMRLKLGTNGKGEPPVSLLDVSLDTAVRAGVLKALEEARRVAGTEDALGDHGTAYDVIGALEALLDGKPAPDMKGGV